MKNGLKSVVVGLVALFAMVGQLAAQANDPSKDTRIDDTNSMWFGSDNFLILKSSFPKYKGEKRGHNTSVITPRLGALQDVSNNPAFKYGNLFHKQIANFCNRLVDWYDSRHDHEPMYAGLECGVFLGAGNTNFLSPANPLAAGKRFIVVRRRNLDEELIQKYGSEDYNDSCPAAKPFWEYNQFGSAYACRNCRWESPDDCDPDPFAANADEDESGSLDAFLKGTPSAPEKILPERGGRRNCRQWVCDRSENECNAPVQYTYTCRKTRTWGYFERHLKQNFPVMILTYVKGIGWRTDDTYTDQLVPVPGAWNKDHLLATEIWNMLQNEFKHP